MFSLIYKIFYLPLFNVFFVLFFFIYDYLAFSDFGITIIVLTLTIRILLYPVFHKGMYHQTAIQRLQPKIKDIQDRHKGDMQKQSEALWELYREHKVNPLSGFLFILIQLPVFIAMYGLISGIATNATLPLYGFVSKHPNINETFLGLINMHERAIILIAVASILQFIQGQYSLSQGSISEKKDKNKELSTQEQVGRNMVYIMPAMTAFILWNLPSAFALYWTATAVFSIMQQYLINKSFPKNETLT